MPALSPRRPRRGPGRPARRFSPWFFAVAGVVLAGLLAFVLAVAVLGPDGAAPLVFLAAIVPAVVILVLAAYVDRRVIDPVQRLSRAAERISAGAADGSIEVAGVAAVNALAGAVNELAGRLREQTDALAAERNRIAVVLSSMADGLIIVDRQLRVQRVNDAAARLLQIGAEGVAGESLTAVVRDHELAGILHTAVTEQRSCSADVRVAPSPRRAPGRPARGAALRSRQRLPHPRGRDRRPIRPGC